MPHICMDEILAFLAIFPFIGIYFRRFHMWFHLRFKHRAHQHKHATKKKMSKEEMFECKHTHQHEEDVGLSITDRQPGQER